MFDNMKFPGADKFSNLFFKKADGVVWDLMTGRIGIKTVDGIATLEGEGEDAQININLLDNFSTELPAFAQSTPLDSVKVGDIIYRQGDKPCWVVDKIVKAKKAPAGSTVAKTKAAQAAQPAVDDKISFRLMSVNGTVSTWNPPKVQLLGLDSGVMVLRSLMSMLPGGQQGLEGMQGNMMQTMMMLGAMGEDVDMEMIMPMMLFSGQQGAAGNNMAQNIMMMTMMKKLTGGKTGGSGNNGGFGGGRRSPFN